MADFKVLTINIWHDMQEWPARFATLTERIAELAPDFVTLQEVLERAELPNQARMLAEVLGYDRFFDSVDPVGHHKRYGNAILSRHRIARTGARGLEPFADCRVAVHVGARLGDREVDLYTTHLHHLPQGAGMRAQQIGQVLEFVRETRATDQVILTGDFNADPHWPELARLTEQFDDTFALVGEDSGRTNDTTMNPAHGGSPRRIDYVFLERVERPILTARRSRIVLDQPGRNGAWASDHFGVLTEFDWVR